MGLTLKAIALTTILDCMWRKLLGDEEKADAQKKRGKKRLMTQMTM